MFFALFIGSAMMIGSLAISLMLFGVAARMLRWLDDTNTFGYERMPLVFDLGVAGVWILFVLTSAVWGWAALYIALDLFDSLEPALYFSIVSSS